LYICKATFNFYGFLCVTEFLNNTEHHAVAELFVNGCFS